MCQCHPIACPLPLFSRVAPAGPRGRRGVARQINVGVPVRALVQEADDLLWLTSLYHDERALVGVRVSYKPLGAR